MYSICMCFQDYYYAGYVVCFVSVYIYYFLLSSMSRRYKIIYTLIYLLGSVAAS